MEFAWFQVINVSSAKILLATLTPLLFTIIDSKLLIDFCSAGSSLLILPRPPPLPVTSTASTGSLDGASHGTNLINAGVGGDGWQALAVYPACNGATLARSSINYHSQEWPKGRYLSLTLAL